MPMKSVAMQWPFIRLSVSRKHAVLTIAVSGIMIWFGFLFILHLLCLPFVWIDRRIQALWAV